MPDLYPYQTELLDALAKIDMSELEKRIMHNTRGCSKPLLQQEYMQQAYLYGRITGNNIHMIYFDEVSKIDRWGIEYDGRDEPSWKRTMFKKDTLSSTPSAAKRSKLRAKRKKRK